MTPIRSTTPDVLLEEVDDLCKLDPTILEKALMSLNDESPVPTQVAAPSKETPDTEQDERVKKVCCTIL